jgi:hypothetical protein
MNVNFVYGTLSCDLETQGRKFPNHGLKDHWGAHGNVAPL